ISKLLTVPSQFRSPGGSITRVSSAANEALEFVFPIWLRVNAELVCTRIVYSPLVAVNRLLIVGVTFVSKRVVPLGLFSRTRAVAEPLTDAFARTRSVAPAGP